MSAKVKKHAASESGEIWREHLKWCVKVGLQLPKMYSRYKSSGDTSAALLVQANLIEFRLKQLLCSVETLVSESVGCSHEGGSCSSDKDPDRS